jgi:acyl-CoA reductase-like NAD-dependent aldehyde dehydrogenase
MIVCADVDIDRAVDGAVWAHFGLTGQACISVERLYVEEPIYDEFVQKLVAQTSQLRLGMDTKHDYSCDIGSMETEQQRAIVSRHVEDALNKAPRCSPAGSRETKACSTSRRCWSTSTRAWPACVRRRSAPRCR